MIRSVFLGVFFFLCSFTNGLISNELHCEHNTLWKPSLEEGRIFWGSLGDLIEAAPFLPITINVPDIIYGFGEMMSNMYQYMFGGSSEGSSSDESTPRIYLELIETLIDSV